MCCIIVWKTRYKMRKFITICLIILLMPALCACASSPAQGSGDARLRIAATVFPAYDFTRQIAGERAEVTLLVPPGSESHSYEPTPQDMLLLKDCALLVANGGESEAWLDSVADGLDGNVPILRMLDCVTALEEETREGMQYGGVLSRAHGHDTHAHTGHEHDGHDEHEEEFDEHVWTSPANAVEICRAICARLCAADPAGAEYYRGNFRDYSAKLSALDAEFRAAVDAAPGRTLIFADRFPVRYFVEEYGLDYYAAFPGCADDAEPSARTVAFLIDKVRAEGVRAVFYIEFSNEKMADIICEETGCEKLLFHSCHNVSADELRAGVGYLDLMEQNLAGIKEALG